MKFSRPQSLTPCLPLPAKRFKTTPCHQRLPPADCLRGRSNAPKEQETNSKQRGEEASSSPGWAMTRIFAQWRTGFESCCPNDGARSRRHISQGPSEGCLMLTYIYRTLLMLNALLHPSESCNLEHNRVIDLTIALTTIKFARGFSGPQAEIRLTPRSSTFCDPVESETSVPLCLCTCRVSTATR